LILAKSKRSELLTTRTTHLWRQSADTGKPKPACMWMDAWSELACSVQASAHTAGGSSASQQHADGRLYGIRRYSTNTSRSD